MVTFAATYALVWLVLAGYVSWMSSRQRRLIEQYARLQQQLSKFEIHAAQDHSPVRKVA